MAETRTIRTVLELNAQRFNAGAASAAASSRKLAAELGAIGDAQGAQKANYDRVANSLLGIGTAAAAGLGLAAKASMDWESAWAGVLKTVDGTPEQLAAVEDGLRGLAKELPASHQEIAAVAEAAGQLGVETGSVVEFTRTMINLGETTNLSAEEAATSLARFSNIMGTSQDDVDRLGSALVGLGNNFETTEGEILAMGMRLSGIGAQLGMTEGDVLGLATAMSSVGIEAEAGGTAMTLGMKKIDKAVREGGESLSGFAEVAGMSNDEFAKLWGEDTAAGLDAFVHGLSRVGEEGGSVAATLDDLGIKGIRESDTFLRLAANADGLSDALAQGNDEFEKNLALTEEAAKRYATTESQLQMAKNALIDAGIDLGASLLPVLADAAGHVASLAEAFGDLPSPVQDAVVQFGAIAGGTALLAGAAMKAVPALMDTWDAFKRLQTTSPAVAGALGKVSKAVGITAVAFTGLSMLSELGNSLTDFSIGANEAADMAMRTADAVDPLQVVFGGMGEEAYLASAGVDEMADTLSTLANGGMTDWASDKIAGLANVFGANISTMEDARVRLEEYGQGLAGLAETDLPTAQMAFSNLWESFGGGEEAGENLLKTMPALREHLIGVANAAGLATDDQTLLKLATGELVPVVDDATGSVVGYKVAQDDAEAGTDDTTDAVQAQIDALQELEDQLQETASLLLGMRGSQRDFEAAIDDATAAVEANGKTLDISTEKGRANEAALDAVADATFRWVDSMPDNATAEELDSILSQGREAFLETADAMGMGTEEAEKLADELGLIPQFVETEVRVQTEQARAEWDALWEETGHHPPEVPVDADTTPAEGTVAEFSGTLGDKPAGAVPVDADTGFAEDKIVKLEEAVNNAGGYVTINGTTLPAEGALTYLQSVIDNSDGTVTINGITVPADESLSLLIGAINASHGEVDITADTSEAESDANHTARDRTSTVTQNASTGAAERQLNHAARSRTSYITQIVSRVGNAAGMSYSGMAEGGWLNPGLNAGGWVPGPYPGPGIDNTWMPVKSGLAAGGLAIQPLAGTEFVVNGESARQWGPALEAINSGMSRAEVAALVGAQTHGSVSVSQQISGLNAYEVARESEAQMRHVLRDAVPTLAR